MTGYESKRAAAQDKLEDDDTQVYQDHDDALTIAYQSGFYDGKKAAAQEPVATLFGTLPVYDIPPQRLWVGLTAEEILDLFDATNVYGSKWIEFAREIEQLLREKNT